MITIPQYCLQISELLQKSDPNWSELFAWFAEQYALDPKDTLTKIRHQYGGMGSFSDLVLYHDGAFDSEAMERLVVLRDQLYDAVVAEIIELRSKFTNPMHIITPDNILNILIFNKTISDGCDHLHYLGWNHANKEAVSFVEFGVVKADPKSTDEIDLDSKSPIDLETYPYYTCKVLQCEKCKNLFFHFVESEGQPQAWYRLIRKELVDLDVLKPKTQMMIDSGRLSFHCTVYKNPDLTYEISIYKDIAPGLEIYHQMTSDEQVRYLKNGISTLSERIKDMDSNFNNYKVVSMR